MDTQGILLGGYQGSPAPAVNHRLPSGFSVATLGGIGGAGNAGEQREANVKRQQSQLHFGNYSHFNEAPSGGRAAAGAGPPLLLPPGGSRPDYYGEQV